MTKKPMPECSVEEGQKCVEIGIDLALTEKTKKWFSKLSEERQEKVLGSLHIEKEEAGYKILFEPQNWTEGKDVIFGIIRVTFDPEDVKKMSDEWWDDQITLIGVKAKGNVKDFPDFNFEIDFQGSFRDFLDEIE